MAEERRDCLDDLGLNYIDHSVRVNKRDRVRGVGLKNTADV